MKPDLYALPDDLKDLVANVKHVAHFHASLGAAWRRDRSKHFKTMRPDLLDMLDEVAGLMVCETKGCKRLVHGEWDFCLEHGSAGGER